MVYQLDYLSGNYATMIQLKRFTTLILLLMTTVTVNTYKSVSRVPAFKHNALTWYMLYFSGFVQWKTIYILVD